MLATLLYCSPVVLGVTSGPLLASAVGSVAEAPLSMRKAMAQMLVTSLSGPAKFPALVDELQLGGSCLDPPPLMRAEGLWSCLRLCVRAAAPFLSLAFCASWDCGGDGG